MPQEINCSFPADSGPNGSADMVDQGVKLDQLNAQHEDDMKKTNNPFMPAIDPDRELRGRHLQQFTHQGSPIWFRDGRFFCADGINHVRNPESELDASNLTDEQRSELEKLAIKTWPAGWPYKPV